MRAFIIVLLLLTFAAPTMAAEKSERNVLYWYDPMVPGQKFDKPGKSPYMDMDLVPFYKEEAGGGNNIISIDASYQQALGVKTEPAQRREFGKTIHAFGYVEPSTRSEYVVAVRKNGWITDLKASAVGDTVKKGDLLFTLYSPDLIVVQVDYLASLKGKIIGDASQRLRLYGMDEKAIAELKQKGRFLEQTPFYAPADGTVTALNVRKGSFVDMEDNGETIMTLQDLSQVWVNAHVPIRDLQFLSAGTPATITVTGTGETYKASVDFIYPETDLQDRKGMARLVLDNPEGRLKPNMPVDVMFAGNVEPRLAVSEEAVLYDQMGAHIITVVGEGHFQPVMVETGITSEGLTEITSGLSEEQTVVTSGQFMIDAESNLRGGIENMTGMNMEPGHDQ